MDAGGCACLSKWLLLANSRQGIIYIAIVVLKISLNTMGQPFLIHGYYKMHFYLKCVILIISLNYFHAQQKKKKNANAEKE